jgi:hypothetical protein
MFRVNMTRFQTKPSKCMQIFPGAGARIAVLLRGAIDEVWGPCEMKYGVLVKYFLKNRDTFGRSIHLLGLF